MQISSKNLGPIGPDASRSTQQAGTPDAKHVRSGTSNATSTDRADRVEISDAGRSLAARDGSADVAAPAGAGLDPARKASIRGRVLNGAYDTLEVVDAVSRRLLDSGDL